jgi:hypothetical protein
MEGTGSSARSIVRTSDGGYIFTGFLTDSLGSRLWVVKLAPDMTEVNESNPPLPEKALIASNYPNPFNSSTMIKWSGGDVEIIEIFNVIGQKIWARQIPANSNNSIVWDCRNDFGFEIGSGIYFAKLTGKQNTTAIKLIYQK